MRLIIELDLDNDAFQWYDEDGEENGIDLAAVTAVVAKTNVEMLERSLNNGINSVVGTNTILDYNGNSVGHYILSEHN